MGVKPRSIDVHIEELVLEGFSPADRVRIGEAMERELSRLFAHESLVTPGPSHNFDRVDAGEFRMPAGGAARAVGREAARSVFRGLQAPASRPKGGR